MKNTCELVDIHLFFCGGVEESHVGLMTLLLLPVLKCTIMIFIMITVIIIIRITVMFITMITVMIITIINITMTIDCTYARKQAAVCSRAPPPPPRAPRTIDHRQFAPLQCQDQVHLYCYDGQVVGVYTLALNGQYTLDIREPVIYVLADFTR